MAVPSWCSPIADAAASSFYKGLEPTSLRIIEDRYARILRPVVFHRKNRFEGYGIKLWPPETRDWLSEEPLLSWVQETYRL